MRQTLTWTAVLALGLATGCGAGTGTKGEAGPESLERDLRLGSAAPPVVEVASAVELGRPVGIARLP
jgi:hypothetical protein